MRPTSRSAYKVATHRFSRNDDSVSGGETLSKAQSAAECDFDSAASTPLEFASVSKLKYDVIAWLLPFASFNCPLLL